ncbi:ABC transporter ATP-binding protein NatA [Abditibacteriota bacterium]|nr:ABC transporter ATP-binding protein NatA [Abditibacteriota bacterium]
MPSSSDVAIEVRDLRREFQTHLKQPGFSGAVRGLFHREYQTKIAVSDLNFSIQKGEFVGFLGPNGAGKTTTLKMLSGVLHPTSGEAHVLGFVPWKREAAFQKRFSLVLGQKNQLWWDLPAYDSFDLNREIYDVPVSDFKAKVEELGELLDITKLLHVPVRKLSLGERMKCELAASLLHSPEVLFLDEPTIGLDLISQARIREFLREYNEKTGMTVILTSHYMADISALCRRVIVINEGKAAFDGPLADLSARFAQMRRVHLTLDHAPTPEERERANQMGENVQVEGTRLSLSVPRDDVPDHVNQLLAAFAVQDLEIADVELETVIRDVFENSGSSEAVEV